MWPRKAPAAGARDRTTMTDATLGVLLAGGLARRMGGGDKPLKRVLGRTILDRVVSRIAPQVDGLIINANGDTGRFGFLGIPVVADDVPDFAGPLAGILAALDWAALHRPDVDDVVSLAADSPYLPRDLVARLHQSRKDAGVPLACARSGDQTHPVIGLWPVHLRTDLRQALVVEDIRKIDRWTARHGVAHAHWPAEPYDPFFNANTPDDVTQAEVIATTYQDA